MDVDIKRDVVLALRERRESVAQAYEGLATEALRAEGTKVWELAEERRRDSLVKLDGLGKAKRASQWKGKTGVFLAYLERELKALRGEEFGKKLDKDDGLAVREHGEALPNALAHAISKPAEPVRSPLVSILIHEDEFSQQDSTTTPVRITQRRHKRRPRRPLQEDQAFLGFKLVRTVKEVTLRKIETLRLQRVLIPSRPLVQTVLSVAPPRRTRASRRNQIRTERKSIPMPRIRYHVATPRVIKPSIPSGFAKSKEREARSARSRKSRVPRIRLIQRDFQGAGNTRFLSEEELELEGKNLKRYERVRRAFAWAKERAKGGDAWEDLLRRGLEVGGMEGDGEGQWREANTLSEVEREGLRRDIEDFAKGLNRDQEGLDDAEDEDERGEEDEDEDNWKTRGRQHQA